MWGVSGRNTWGTVVTQLAVHGKRVEVRENRSLNIIRSVSALFVVLGHVRLLFFVDYPDAHHDPVTAILYACTSLGNLSVIVFFVLSGYWVGGGVVSKLRRNEFRWRSYATSRLSRLWLVLVPALLLTLIVDQAGRAFFPQSDIYSHTSSYAGVPETVSYSLPTFIGNLLFLQKIHVSEFGLDKPLWSLAYEFWYYVMFPALLLILWRGNSKTRRISAGVILVLSAIVAGPEVFILIPAWLAGAAVGAYRSKAAHMLSKLSSRTMAWLHAGGFTLTFGTMVMVRQVHFPGATGEWLVAAVASLLVFVCIRDIEWDGWRGKILDSSAKSAHFSYSLYATHMPIIAILAAALVPSVSQRWQMDPMHSLLALCVVIGLIVVGYLFAKVTEAHTDSVRRWIDSRVLNRRSTR